MKFKPKYSISYLEIWNHDENAHDLPEELKRAYHEIEKLTEALQWYADGMPFRDDIGNQTELARKALGIE